MKKNVYLIIFFCIVSNNLMFSQGETSQKKNPMLADKFKFEIGVFYPTQSFNIGANGNSPNDEIDFNEALNLSKNDITTYFSFDWRFSRMWKLTAEYVSFKNQNTVSLKKDIHWEDYILEQGSFVSAGVNMKMYRIFIERLILKERKYELGAGLGVHALNISAFIEGEAMLNGQNLASDRYVSDAILPLPNIGIWYIYAPSDKWSFTTRVDWFAITVGEYSGGIWDIEPKVNFEISKHIGIGASYRFFNLNAKVTKTNWDGGFDASFNGPAFGIHSSF